MLYFKNLSNQQTLTHSAVLPCLLLILSLLSLNETFAQTKGGKVGVGFQVGDPTGLNLHFRDTKPMRLDILFAWDFSDDDRDFFFVNVHGLWFKPIGGAEPFNFYYGPGAFIGFKDDNPRDNNNDDLVLGFSGNFGINYEFSRFDIFLQLTPRLSLIPDTDVELGGGLGARFFF